MTSRTPARCALFILVSTVFSAPLFAQYVCEYGNGPLDATPPAGITTSEIIETFATKESTFKAARDRYGYTLDVTIQTVNGDNAVDGAYHQVSEFVLNDQGAREERTAFAPQNTLRSLSLTKDDLDDIRDRLPFVLTADHLSRFSITYVGKQHVDELDTYVFDVAPKGDKPENDKPKNDKPKNDKPKNDKPKNDEKDESPPPVGFQGRVWVDNRDLAIVKTCGKARADEKIVAGGRTALASRTPTFVTYREQIDGKWFTTYARADEFLHFPNGSVHIRELIKYSNFKVLPSKQAR